MVSSHTTFRPHSDTDFKVSEQHPQDGPAGAAVRRFERGNGDVKGPAVIVRTLVTRW
jgi:hypothetical protein